MGEVRTWRHGRGVAATQRQVHGQHCAVAFRQRLKAQALEKGSLHGTAGRKAVLTPQELARAMAQEPWDAIASG